jgi:hypothetical protein
MDLLKNLFCCGGPPQTARSSGRKQQNQAHIRRIIIKGLLKLAQVAIAEHCQWRLAGGVDLAPQMYHPTRSAKRRTATTANFRFIRQFPFSASKETGDSLRKQNHDDYYDGRQPEQNHTRRAALFT